MLIEICTGNFQDALTAQSAGADRVEFCADLRSGGITPSHGALVLAASRLQVPFFPIIRPRGGDFLYNGDEYTIMREDVLFCRLIGCAGVVLGLLLPDGAVDEERTARLVEAAYPMEVTFHRAFDATPHPLSALEAVIRAGCTRILTSGGRPSAPEGTEALQSLIQAAAGRITILPGGGIRPGNAAALAAATGVTELHASLLPDYGSALQADDVALLRTALA